MRYRMFELPDSAGLSEEEIVGTVRDILNRNNYKPEDCAYRALSCDESKLRRILETGTDRVSEEWEEQARLKQKEAEEAGVFLPLEETRFRTNPSYIWAVPLEDLADQLKGIRIEQNNFLAILAYRKKYLKVEEDFHCHVSDYHHFKGNPLDALAAVFTFK